MGAAGAARARAARRVGAGAAARGRGASSSSSRVRPARATTTTPSIISIAARCSPSLREAGQIDEDVGEELDRVLDDARQLRHAGARPRRRAAASTAPAGRAASAWRTSTRRRRGACRRRSARSPASARWRRRTRRWLLATSTSARPSCTPTARTPTSADAGNRPTMRRSAFLIRRAIGMQSTRSAAAAASSRRMPSASKVTSSGAKSAGMFANRR